MAFKLTSRYNSFAPKACVQVSKLYERPLNILKPLLKWAGGKRHIAPVIEQFLPADWNNGTYFEPFLGGAALFLHLSPKSARLADVNPWLVGFYVNVREQPNELFALISKYAKEFDAIQQDQKKSQYLELRKEFNNDELSLKSSALFYVLNKLCFNGLYRENLKGKFNVPFGQKTRFPSLSEDDFVTASRRLLGVELQCSDFEQAVLNAQPGDFVYFDPPYVPINATANFTSYSSEGFGIEAQRRLAELMRTLRQKGVNAMLSNSATEVTSQIYSGLRQVTISAPRMVSAKASGRGRIDELLIMNY